MYYTDTGILTQEQANKKPNKNDIRDTKTLLKDFLINCSTPEFLTCSQLINWRTNMIKNKIG